MADFSCCRARVAVSSCSGLEANGVGGIRMHLGSMGKSCFMELHFFSDMGERVCVASRT